MSQKSDKDDELDTETTFAEMNLEGFRWYDPSKKKGNEKKVRQKIGKEAYRQLVRSAFSVFLPYFVIFLLSMGIVGVLLYLWLS